MAQVRKFGDGGNGEPGQMVLTQEEVEQLLPSVPRDVTHVTVHKPITKEGGGKHELNISTLPDSIMSIESSIREILSNLMDQLAQSNGGNRTPSFANITMLHGKRGDADVIFFHNGRVKLGEISIDRARNTISFVNYGPSIRDSTQILAFGVSEKRGIPNQIGQHCEGFKRAVASLLHKGRYGVTVEAAVMDSGQTEFRRWKMFADARKIVCYNETKIQPYQRIKFTPCDFHRIEIIITGSKALDFDLFDFMVPKQELIRDQSDANDFGSIIFDPELRGHIYVWHVYVVEWEDTYLRFGYDVFLPIRRERNGVDEKEFTKVIANVWSREIVTSRDKAIQFYDEVVMKTFPDNDIFCECEAIRFLSQQARDVLISVFRERNGPDTVPFTAEDKLSHAPLLLCPLVVVPLHTMPLFNSNQKTSFKDFVASEKTRLVKGADISDQFPSFVADVFPLFSSFTFKITDAPSVMCYLIFREPNRMVLNKEFVKDMSVDVLTGKLFYILSRVDGGALCDPGEVVSNLKKKFAPPPPPPVVQHLDPPMFGLYAEEPAQEQEEENANPPAYKRPRDGVRGEVLTDDEQLDHNQEDDPFPGFIVMKNVTVLKKRR
jgi:hypothetical protein